MRSRLLLCLCLPVVLLACSGKPSGVSDEFYEKYKLLGAPKILYQCGEKVAYSAGVGVAATYNHILGEAQSECSEAFKLLEGQQYATDKR